MTARRLRVGVLAVVAAAVSVGASGCGGGGGADGAVSWKGTPQVFAPRDLPRDRVLLGRVRNTSLRPITLQAAKIRVRDAEGHVLASSGRFTASFAHGLFGAFQQPASVPASELIRLGRVVQLRPNETAPFYAAWRGRVGSRGPFRIDTGQGRLEVPGKVAAAAG